MTTTTKKVKSKPKTMTKKPKTKSSSPPKTATSKSKAKRASGATSGGRVVDGAKAKWDKKAKQAAAQQGTTSVPKARTRAGKIRIAHADKDHAAAISKVVKDLPLSKDHVCWKRNGKVNEIYYRMTDKTPMLMSAPADSPVDENGYRTKDATAAVTGLFHIKQSIKRLTGKTPSALGIKLPRENESTASTKPAKPRKKREGLSGLDAAAQVVAKAREPLNAKTICERALALGWKTNGATPHATLYAAMIREIAAKGDEARFIKVDKGLFTANGKAV